jgi:hypothetical protein
MLTDGFCDGCRSFDILMKSFTNAKERNAQEWAALFTKADPRFEFQGICIPPGAKCAVIEAKWVSEGS